MILSKRKSILTKKQKSKRSFKKNNLNGGITFKSGKYGFFCNKETYNSLFGNVVKGQNAPSINKLNSQLSLKAYRLENNSGVAKLVISNNERAIDAVKLIGVNIGNIIISPFLIGFVIPGLVSYYSDEKIQERKQEKIKSRTTDTYVYNEFDKLLDKGLNAEIGYYKSQNSQLTNQDLVSINLENDKEIEEFIDVFISLKHLEKLKIDCCVIINVNPLKTNTYDRIVNKNPNSSVILSSIKGADKE